MRQGLRLVSPKGVDSYVNNGRRLGFCGKFLITRQNYLLLTKIVSKYNTLYDNL